MADPPTPYENDVEVQKFFAFLQEEQTNFAGESQTNSNIYTPRPVVARYFTDGRGCLDDLLRAVLREEQHVIPTSETIIQQYLTVLTILLSIGQAHYLNRFIERDYNDERLPLFDRPRYFPKADNGSSFFDTFFGAQFRFCPVRFSKNPVNLQLEPEQILPLRGKQQMRIAGPATWYKVELHEDYDSFGQESGPFEIDLGATVPTAHTYIFKVYQGAACRTAYDKELTAFLYLQKTGQLLGKTLVGFYGSFIQDNTFTIVTEFADRGTFDDYVSSVPPPLNGEDIMRLWESLLKLHEALHAIHNLSAPYSDEIKQYSLLRGWHQYLKPENIGVVSVQTNSDYDCQFRIIDLGISHETTDVESLNTRMYMAPECMQDGSQRQINMQAADIWSLGCIFSEFAAWVTFGPPGFKDYRVNRADEGRELGVRHIGAFHDGQNLLQSVRAWNYQAVDSKNPDDRVTEPILQQMVEEMLYEDGDARPSTRQLKMKINKILTRAREQHIADLRRFDSMTSNSTSYSSMGLSTRSHLSPHVSIRSTRSGSSDSGLGYGIALTERLGRSGTGKSSNAYREHGLPSPSIDEDRESNFSPGSQVASPILPTGAQQLSVPSTNRNTAYSFVQERLTYEPAASIPVRSTSHGHAPSDTQSIHSSSTMDTALINGEDKEIVVARGSLQPTIRRPTTDASYGVPTMPLPPVPQTTSAPQSPQSPQSPQRASPYGAPTPFTVTRRPLAPVMPHAPPPPVPPIPSSISGRPYFGSSRPNTSDPQVGAQRLAQHQTNIDVDEPHSVAPPPAYTVVERNPQPSNPIYPNQDVQRSLSSPGSVTLTPNSLAQTVSAGGSSVATTVEIRPDNDLRRSISSPSDRPVTAMSNGTGIAPSERSLGGPTSRSGSNITAYKPNLNLIDGLIWLNQKKGAASNAMLRDESYLNTLADRDFIFLIDDARSMRAHREMTSRAVRLLSWLLKKHDKNGMDLYFMNKPGKTHARPGHSSDLQRPLLNQLDAANGTTNVASRLVEILQDFRQRNAAGTGVPQQGGRGVFRSNSNKTVTGAKKIMVYVLTDGIWERNAEITLKGTMEKLGATLLAQGAPDSAVGVQFVRAVEEPSVVEKMKGLVGRYSNKICVDTEFLEGNVFRLLLGPVTDIWDDEREQEQAQGQDQAQVPPPA